MIRFHGQDKTLIVKCQVTRDLNGIIWEELKVPGKLQNPNIPKSYKSPFNLF